MTVRELMERLSSLDPEAKVVVLNHCCDGCYGDHSEPERVEEVHGKWVGAIFTPGDGFFTASRKAPLSSAVVISSGL